MAGIITAAELPTLSEARDNIANFADVTIPSEPSEFHPLVYAQHSVPRSLAALAVHRGDNVFSIETGRDTGHAIMTEGLLYSLNVSVYERPDRADDDGTFRPQVYVCGGRKDLPLLKGSFENVSMGLNEFASTDFIMGREGMRIDEADLDPSALDARLIMIDRLERMESRRTGVPDPKVLRRVAAQTEEALLEASVLTREATTTLRNLARLTLKFV